MAVKRVIKRANISSLTLCHYVAQTKIPIKLLSRVFEGVRGYLYTLLTFIDFLGTFKETVVLQGDYMRFRRYLIMVGVLVTLSIFLVEWKAEVYDCGRSIQMATMLHKYGLTWSEVVGLSVQECLDSGENPEIPR